MKRVFSHVIKIALVLAMIICWVLSIGYTNRLASVKNTFNIYFDEEEYFPADIYKMQKEEKDKGNSLVFTGWHEKEKQTVLNSNFNRRVESNIIFICGQSSLVAEGPILFEDDINWCLIDEETAYKLFGSNDVIGNTIIYDSREFIIRGIHRAMEDTIIMQAESDSKDKIQGLLIDISNDGIKNIKLISERYGVKEYGVNSTVYYNLGKMCTSMLPLIILLIIVWSALKKAIEIKDRPVLFIFSIMMIIVWIIAFFCITRYKISIPVDILPNKWSDFDYWSKFFQECMDKIKYVIYMKKYMLDIYVISYLNKIFLCTIIAIILFFVNRRNIEINSMKELFISIIALFIITFMAIYILKESIFINKSSAVIWLIYPYYLLYRYVYLIKEQFLKRILR
ncbi:MAG: ABC transporter permease [Clostridium sp.]